MPTKHISKLIEAYLDGQLSAEACQQVEAHIRRCPACAQRLFDARRVAGELGPVLRHTLGQPVPPPMLRQTVRAVLQEEKQVSKSFYARWFTPMQIFNAVGNVGLLALLAVGVWFLARGQTPWLNSSSATILPAKSDNEAVATVVPTVSAAPIAPGETAQSQVREFRSSLSDTIRLPASLSPAVTSIAQSTHPTPAFQVKPQSSAEFPPRIVREPDYQPQPTSSPQLPEGVIAFALYDPTAGIEMYQLHLIGPDGSNHRQIPLKDVSEPALYPGTNDYRLALRTWDEAPHPRTILTTDFSTDAPRPVTHFWEDAQPDWSPTENRIIFASQRESDRRWRLYTVWGDGSAERNLRREGRSPTFAPDGYRFAFESCNQRGEDCGLWVGDLEHSEYESKLLLNDPLAKSPDWSPTGEEIVYMANPNGNWDLYLVSSDGRNVRQLTNTQADEGLPAWSPDGKWLAFVSNRDESWGIWIFEVATGELYKTTTFETGSLTPPNSLPYTLHGSRFWWDEQISWGP